VFSYRRAVKGAACAGVLVSKKRDDKEFLAMNKMNV
jgi:hypothetical protein